MWHKAWLPRWRHFTFVEKKIGERKEANAALIQKIRRLQTKQNETLGIHIYIQHLQDFNILKNVLLFA